MVPLANAVRQPSPPTADRHARMRRDASLLRVSSLTRAVGAAVVVLVGVVGFYVSRAFPGHQSTPHAAGTVTGGASGASPGTGGATSGGASPSGATAGGSASPSGGISAPTSPPVTTPAPAPVVSGAS